MDKFKFRDSVNYMIDLARTGNKYLADKDVENLSLDVEGSEIHAVNGAEDYIKSVKANISVCIYHSFNDYLKIPILLHEYTQSPICIRQHSTIPVIETVAYVCKKCSTRKMG